MTAMRAIRVAHPSRSEKSPAPQHSNERFRGDAFIHSAQSLWSGKVFQLHSALTNAFEETRSFAPHGACGAKSLAASQRRHEHSRSDSLFRLVQLPRGVSGSTLQRAATCAPLPSDLSSGPSRVSSFAEHSKRNATTTTKHGRRETEASTCPGRPSPPYHFFETVGRRMSLYAKAAPSRSVVARFPGRLQSRRTRAHPRAKETRRKTRRSVSVRPMSDSHMSVASIKTVARLLRILEGRRWTIGRSATALRE